MPPSSQLAAILFTDIVGYTALMGTDEKKAYELLQQNRQIQQPIISRYKGKWIKEMGDGVLATFLSVSDAVFCALAIQDAVDTNGEFKLRIGIHQGEVIFEDNDVFGDGVNIASRIQSLATPGSIWISESVYLNINNKKEISTKYIGEKNFKNIKEPLRIYEVFHSVQSEVQSSTLTQQRTRNIPEKSIAVLPFVNMSNDPEQEYFSDGMAEELINSLHHLKD